GRCGTPAATAGRRMPFSASSGKHETLQHQERLFLVYPYHAAVFLMNDDGGSFIAADFLRPFHRHRLCFFTSMARLASSAFTARPMTCPRFSVSSGR
ncbi:hypothetical protein, partial [Bacillus sonorensis]